jgi:diacylglycerol kinase family enzyme
VDSSSLLIVLNPAALHGEAATGFAALRAALPEEVVIRETVGDGRDAERLAEWTTTLRPRTVAAAGGDGTVRAVVCALMDMLPATRPALGLVPLGTANNVARSLGYVRLTDAAAARALAAALLAHGTRPLDLGRANGEWFVGSCAAGMDAAILAARNRWRARWRLGRTLGGYPLYLAACAVGLARHRAVAAAVRLDGGPAETQPVHNLLVLNTALYAGEFRFEGADHSDDGRLDVHAFADAAAYVRGFVTAWRRHLGKAVAPPPLRRVATLSATFAAPIAFQLDGEEAGMVCELVVEVTPAAVRVVDAPPAG